MIIINTVGKRRKLPREIKKSAANNKKKSILLKSKEICLTRFISRIVLAITQNTLILLEMFQFPQGIHLQKYERII